MPQTIDHAALGSVKVEDAPTNPTPIDHDALGSLRVGPRETVIPPPPEFVPPTAPIPLPAPSWRDRPMSDMQPHERAAYEAEFVAPQKGKAELAEKGPLEHAKMVEYPIEYDRALNKALIEMYPGLEPSARAAIVTKSVALLSKSEDREMTADQLIDAGFTKDSEGQPLVKGSGEIYKVPMNRIGEPMGVYKRALESKDMVQGWTMRNGKLQGGMFDRRTGAPISFYDAIPPSGLPHITEGQVFLWNANTGQFERDIRTTTRQLAVPVAGMSSGGGGAAGGGTSVATGGVSGPASSGAPGVPAPPQQPTATTTTTAPTVTTQAPIVPAPSARAGSLGPGRVPAPQSGAVRNTLVPTREIGTIMFSDPATPWRESLESFADIADDPSRAKQVGTVANLIVNGLQKGGDQGADVAAHFGGVGLSLGAFGNWLNNLVGMPGLQSKAQVDTIYNAYSKLPERDQRAVKSIIAAYGVIPGLRAATRGSALEFYVSKLENEIATFGNTTSRQQYYTNMSTIARELHNVYKSLGMESTEGQQYASKEKLYSYLSRLTPDEVKNANTLVRTYKDGNVEVLRNGKWVHP